MSSGGFVGLNLFGLLCIAFHHFLEGVRVNLLIFQKIVGKSIQLVMMVFQNTLGTAVCVVKRGVDWFAGTSDWGAMAAGIRAFRRDCDEAMENGARNS